MKRKKKEKKREKRKKKKTLNLQAKETRGEVTDRQSRTSSAHKNGYL